MMLTQLATHRRVFRPRAGAVNRTALAVAALAGMWLGCASARPKPDVWFDACCDSCTADHCEDCNQRKDACGGELGEREAECMVHDAVMMCRPKPPN